MSNTIETTIQFFGSPCRVACDGNCKNAWGINRRPKEQLSDDEDDYAYLSDLELGEAPDDPGTYEGGHAKPGYPFITHNKWCVRECERLSMTARGNPDEVLKLKDFTKRRYNQPWKHKQTA